MAALQEVHYKNKAEQVIGDGEFTYKLLWKGEEKGEGSIGIMVSDDLIKNIVAVERINSRIMSMNLVIGGNVWATISVHCPQSGRSME